MSIYKLGLKESEVVLEGEGEKSGHSLDPGKYNVSVVKDEIRNVFPNHILYFQNENGVLSLHLQDLGGGGEPILMTKEEIASTGFHFMDVD